MENKKWIKKDWTLLLLLVVSPFIVSATVDGDAGSSDLGTFILHNLVLIIGGLVVLAVMVYMVKFFFEMMDIQKKRVYTKQEIEIPKHVKRPSIFSRLYNWATDMVPVEKEADVMLDHNYDGIRELDNRLPAWWVAMFYITIAWGGIYFLYYHFFDYGQSSREEYAMEMKFANEARERLLEKEANLVNEKNVTRLTDPSLLAVGESLYKTNCVACHGLLGEGGVGPNMADNYWISGQGDIKSIFKTVSNGVPEKGMIAWKTQMGPPAIQQVSSYIMGFQGTNPPNGKEPQGNLIEAAESQE